MPSTLTARSSITPAGMAATPTPLLYLQPATTDPYVPTLTTLQCDADSGLRHAAAAFESAPAR